jgi:hypothetical protein
MERSCIAVVYQGGEDQSALMAGALKEILMAERKGALGVAGAALAAA